MGEESEKTQKNIASPTPPQNEDNTIDFSKFSLGKEEKKETINFNHETTNPSPRENQEIKEEPKINFNNNEEQQPDIKLENIIIKETKKTKKEELILGKSGIGETIIPKKIHIERIMLSYIIIGIGIIIIFGVHIYKKYMGAVINEEYESRSKYTKIDEKISKYTKINEYESRSKKTTIFLEENAKKNLETIINNNKLNYIHKKDILTKNTNTLIENILQKSQQLDNIKKEIIKFGFIPQNLYTTIEKNNGLYGIKERMGLLENIKSIIAINTFGYMQSFIESLGSTINQNKDEIEAKINKINQFGEEDIVRYTNNCFLNPYEIGTTCNIINDFENYYTFIGKDEEVDTTFITKLIEYIQLKLEEKTIKTLNIQFLKFNPKEDKIEFTIELNTTSEDEIALNKKGILNPHVFILTNIINLLKQSLLVIGENIKTDQIKTTTKTIRIGSTIFNVNSSSILLSLPIQKNGEREISDFFYK